MALILLNFFLLDRLQYYVCLNHTLSSIILFKITNYGDMKLKSQIRVITPITSKSQDDGLIITGIASTTNKDLQNEIISKSCLESMNKQVVGLNLHLDHNHSYDGVIGVITDSKITKNNELYITANILPEFAKDIREKLEFGLSMGLSIGGIPERNKTNPNIINDIKLLEVSLTPLPANNDSQGSVQIVKGIVTANCFGKACHYLLKNMENENMVNKEVKQKEEKAIEEKPKEESSEFSKEDAIALFNELMAEKEEVIIEELSQKMENKIQTIVNSILEQSEPKEEEKEIVEEKEEEEEPEKNGTDVKANNEETEEEGEDGEVAKALPDLEETSRASKIDNIIIEKFKNDTFLNSESRDMFGRNKKYL